jgi:pilus assembly protein CpaB
MTRPGAVVVVSVVALIFAGLASWGVYSYLQKTAQQAKAAQGESIVVAAADLPVGTKLNATQVKLVKLPKESMPTGCIADPKATAGRVVIRPLATGDVITEQKLFPKEGAMPAGVMTYRVPDGHRAVTVAVNEVAGVAGFLTPQDRVDVVLTTQLPSSKDENISKIVLQNVPILATGQITSEPKDKEGKPVIVPTVTLDLTPGDAEKLVLAASKGSLQLLLRNVIDTAPVEARGATIYKVLGGIERPVVKMVRRAPAPRKVAQAAPRPAPYSVEIIKGTSRTSKAFAID